MFKVRKISKFLGEFTFEIGQIALNIPGLNWDMDYLVQSIFVPNRVKANSIKNESIHHECLFNLFNSITNQVPHYHML